MVYPPSLAVIRLLSRAIRAVPVRSAFAQPSKQPGEDKVRLLGNGPLLTPIDGSRRPAANTLRTNTTRRLGLRFYAATTVVTYPCKQRLNEYPGVSRVDDTSTNAVCTNGNARLLGGEAGLG
jgi:hypothetical protein